MTDTGWIHPIQAFDEWGMTIKFDEVEMHAHALTLEEIAENYAKHAAREPLTSEEKRKVLEEAIND